MKNPVLFFLLFLGCTLTIQAQDLSNRKRLVLPTDTGWISLDTLTPVPSSLRLSCPEDSLNPKEYLELDYVNARLRWKKPPTCKQPALTYRTYPFQLGLARELRSAEAYRKGNLEEGFLVGRPIKNTEYGNTGGIDFGSLDYNGSITRGLSLGNNQSLNLNSSFSLQLAGNITDDIEVLAAITDNNIPIQPEGNTQQLQEFDRVFIQLTKDRHQLIAGDYTLQPKHGYFLRFTRNLQGASYSGGYDAGKYGDVSGQAGFAVARGKYTINELTAQEGNQGPYQLTGAAGETFIIVLAGTERVFVNEELKVRGANEDYIIDYNTGEITFTPNVLITQDLRIRVEFEYAERNYFRSLAYARVEHKVGRFTNSVQFFSERDAKNQPVNIDLTESIRTALSQAGDSVNNAFVSSAQQVEYEEGRILYRLIDTIIDGNAVQFYRYEPLPSDSLYAITFSLVGDGNGDYLPSEAATNGRVFEYVPPINGISQGRYDPVIQLPTPRSQWMATARTEVRIGKGKAYAEWSMSNEDVNTLSDRDDDDDAGHAVVLGMEQQLLNRSDSLRSRSLNWHAVHEYRNQRYRFVEYYRNDVNLQRNWNLQNPEAQRNENLGQTGITYQSKTTQAAYTLSYFLRDTSYLGVENRATFSHTNNGLNSQADLRFLTSRNQETTSQFVRPTASISQAIARLKNWQWKAGFQHEINRITNRGDGFLTNNSFLWQEYSAGIASPDSLQNQYAFDYKLRYQHVGREKQFDSPYMKAHTATLSGRLRTKRKQNLNWQFTYRRLIQDTLQQSDDDLAHFYLGRIDYTFQGWDGVLRGNSLYEIGAGREQRVQYNYIEAPDGQGNFAWQDANANGIQELNEFYVSPFTDQNRFLRLTSNTREFIPVNTTRWNQTINLTPRARWGSEKGFKGVVSKLSTISSLQFERKVFTNGNLRPTGYLSPFSAGLDDSLLVARTIAARNVIYINQTDPKWGLEYTFNYNRNQRLLTSGFERRLLQLHGVNIRWNALKNITLESSYQNGIKENNSDFFFDRQYRYLLQDVEMAVNWLYKAKIKWTTSYRYGFRTNPVPVTGGQFAIIHEAKTECRWNQLGKGAITVGLAYAAIGYNEGVVENEQLRFDMLNGLDNGSNWIWSVAVDRKLLKNLQLNVGYEGRKTGTENPIIHVGRAQVRALF